MASRSFRANGTNGCRGDWCKRAVRSLWFGGFGDGGAGRVGHLAIQIARWRGAHVVTTCSGDDAEFCQSLGAKETIDFGSERFEEMANDVDLVLDVIGGDVQERSWDVVRKGGKLITIAGEEEDAPTRSAPDRRALRRNSSSWR
jgi:NADPH:quinone reductase-like Zn-dependent oxidoreductase